MNSCAFVSAQGARKQPRDKQRMCRYKMKWTFNTRLVREHHKLCPHMQAFASPIQMFKKRRLTAHRTLVDMYTWNTQESYANNTKRIHLIYYSLKRIFLQISHDWLFLIVSQKKNWTILPHSVVVLRTHFVRFLSLLFTVDRIALSWLCCESSQLGDYAHCHVSWLVWKIRSINVIDVSFSVCSHTRASLCINGQLDGIFCG